MAKESLGGKYILVTGGGTGIGKACAILYQSPGAGLADTGTAAGDEDVLAAE